LRADPSSATSPRGTASVLIQVASQLGATLDLDRLAATVVERMVELLGAERALFAIFARNGEIEHAVTHNLEEWSGPPQKLPVSQSIIDDAIRTRQLVVDSDEEVGPQWRQSARVLNLRFLFAMPVEVGNRVVGVLYVDSRQAALRQVADMEGTLVALARLVGTAMENARLAEEAEFRNLLLAQTVHDMQMPLTAGRLNVNLLMNREHDTAEIPAIAVDLAAAMDRMSRLVHHTLKLARSEDHRALPSDVQRFDVPRLLAEQIEGVAYLRRSQQVDIALHADSQGLTAMGWIDRVEGVVHNLLANAFNHAPPGSTIDITVRLRADAGPMQPPRRPSAYLFRRVANLTARHGSNFVEVSFHNAGPALDPALLPRLFAPWTQGRITEERARGFGSTGLGLAICEQCVRSMGGRIWAEPGRSQGATFSFTLPCEGELV
jgi:signal transduction histidine kinase